MSLTLAEFLVRYLKEIGVRHIFGVTGHSIFQITDALFRAEGITFVPTQSELAAAYMAEAYARSGKQLGVCLVSVGPGAANMLGGVAHAFKEWTPLLALSSEVSTTVAGRSATWHEIDQEQIFAPVTRLSASLRRPEEITYLLPAAVRQALGGRGGPVYLGIPVDMQTHVIQVPPAASLSFPRTPAPPAADVLQAAVDLLRAAERPVVIAGEGVYWSGAETETRELAEVLRAPFGTPYGQKGLLSETDPLSLGVIGSGAAPFANPFVQEADLILALGASFGEGLTLGYGHRLIRENVPIIQVDVDAAQIGRSYPAAVAVVADVKQAVSHLLHALRASPLPARQAAQERLTRLAQAKATWQAQVAGFASASTSADQPIDYWSIVGTLRAAMAEDAILVGAVTELKLQRFLAISKVFHTGDFRAIGHGLASALGIKLACPDRQVVLLTGDGSFMMELPDLATLARNNLDLPVLVVHNNAYGSMKHDQLRLFGGRYIATDLFTPDFCEVAHAFGIAARRVESRAELPGVIADVLGRKGPTLLDIVCPVEGL